MKTVIARLPAHLDRAVRRELGPGETILWSGQPLRRHLWSTFGIWLFAIPWTVFALYFGAMSLLPWAASTRTPTWVQLSFGVFMPLFAVPFVLVGLTMLWAPIKAMRGAAHTVYVLTPRRLLQLVEARTRSVKSVLIDQIGPIKRLERADGSGTLRIETHSKIDSDGDRQTETFDVTAVAHVAALERAVLDLADRPKRQD